MNCCAIVPSYNHHKELQNICTRLGAYNLPVILVDDASDVTTASVIDELSRQGNITLVRHTVNQGKGAAVISGFKQANKDGYSHALQIDADGQHDLNDIPLLLEKAMAHPKKLISGQPVYDQSIPKGRKYGRYVTHFWVWAETLSLSIKDTMCGFRVYPIAPCISLTTGRSFGARMDFDIEIMVRLYWLGVMSEFIPTKVTYPEKGLSHFRPLHDNLLISWLHTRLFFGMLLRAPTLLARKFS